MSNSEAAGWQLLNGATLNHGADAIQFLDWLNQRAKLMTPEEANQEVADTRRKIKESGEAPWYASTLPSTVGAIANPVTSALGGAGLWGQAGLGAIIGSGEGGSLGDRVIGGGIGAVTAPTLALGTGLLAKGIGKVARFVAPKFTGAVEEGLSGASKGAEQKATDQAAAREIGLNDIKERLGVSPEQKFDAQNRMATPAEIAQVRANMARDQALKDALGKPSPPVPSPHGQGGPITPDEIALWGSAIGAGPEEIAQANGPQPTVAPSPPVPSPHGQGGPLTPDEIALWGSAIGAEPEEIALANGPQPTVAPAQAKIDFPNGIPPEKQADFKSFTTVNRESETPLSQRFARAGITPKQIIPEATELNKQFANVGDQTRLTAGQLAPRSGIGITEQALLSSPDVGPEIFAKREAARQAWQNLGLRKALPEGLNWEDVAQEPSVSDKLAKIYQGFEPAYSEIKGAYVPPNAGPQSLPNAFEQAANNDRILAGDPDRQAVSKFLKAQTTILKPNEEGQVPVEQLMQIRSNIRDEIGPTQSNAVQKMLSQAEDATTKAIEDGLPEEMAQKLKTTDSQYRNYKILENAQFRAGDRPGGFGSFQLESALKKDVGSPYARGEGGDLRDLIRTGRAVFESTSPPTGARAVTLKEKLIDANRINAVKKANNMAHGGEVNQDELHGWLEQKAPSFDRARTANPAADFIGQQISPDYQRRVYRGR
jgi:hypothetical protein